PSAIGAPRTLSTRPSSGGPTGTSKGRPVSNTVAPRARPLVGVSATVRTVRSSTWPNTSRTIDSSGPVSSRTPTGGSSPSKRTSTTLPRTATVRPHGAPRSSIPRTPSSSGRTGSAPTQSSSLWRSPAARRIAPPPTRRTDVVVTVTGSTGTIGTELMDLLSRAGVPSRGVLRDFTRARPLRHVAWIQADLREETTLVPVLAGTRSLFLLTDNSPGFGATQIGVLQAAERSGVEHVVKLSALGASGHSRSGLGREHWEVEQALRESSMTWTILRPHSFMQNWLGDQAAHVRSEGVVRAAIGDGRVPFIDARDIAAVAAEAL